MFHVDMFLTFCKHCYHDIHSRTTKLSRLEDGHILQLLYPTVVHTCDSDTDTEISKTAYDKNPYDYLRQLICCICLKGALSVNLDILIGSSQTARRCSRNIGGKRMWHENWQVNRLKYSPRAPTFAQSASCREPRHSACVGNMAAYSKLLSHSCYELGHTWQPSCVKTALALALITYSESFKIYAPLYAIAAVLRRKKKDYLLKKLLLEIFQSTVFLGTNAVGYLSAFCLCRHLLRCFSFFTVGFVPGLLASFLAILLERKDRRSLLALYVSNVAVEMLYNMSVSRHLIKPMKNGEVLLFSVVIAVYMYLFKSRKGLNPSVRSAIVFIVGPSELPPGESTGTKVQHSRPGDSPGSRESDMCLASGTFIPPEGAAVYKRFLPSDVWPILEMKHSLCRHQGGCVYTLIKSSVRCLCGGFALQAAVKVVSSISSILRRPRALRHALLHQHNFQLGAFLASFTALFQGMSCLLRHLLGQENATHGLLAGLLAGASMFLYKSSTVALYMTSKLTEILYMKGIEAGLLPYVQSADVLLYAMSTALIIHVAILEPHNLRPTYWKFLLKVTHGRLGEINRKLLDIYGTGASKLYPNFKPH